MQALNDDEQEKCKSSIVLCEDQIKKFNPQHNETVLSMQCCKLIRQQSGNPEEWIGHVRIKANECEYKRTIY